MTDKEWALNEMVKYNQSIKLAQDSIYKCMGILTDFSTSELVTLRGIGKDGMKGAVRAGAYVMIMKEELDRALSAMFKF